MPTPAPAAEPRPIRRVPTSQLYGVNGGWQGCRPELPRHVGDHDPGLEEQPRLEAEGALVVQEMLPPVADHVFGQVDDHHVAEAVAADGGHVVEDRAGDVAVLR